MVRDSWSRLFSDAVAIAVVSWSANIVSPLNGPRPDKHQHSEKRVSQLTLTIDSGELDFSGYQLISEFQTFKASNLGGLLLFRNAACAVSLRFPVTAKDAVICDESSRRRLEEKEMPIAIGALLSRAN